MSVCSALWYSCLTWKKKNVQKKYELDVSSQLSINMICFNESFYLYWQGAKKISDFLSDNIWNTDTLCYWLRVNPKFCFAQDTGDIFWWKLRILTRLSTESHLPQNRDLLVRAINYFPYSYGPAKHRKNKQWRYQSSISEHVAEIILSCIFKTNVLKYLLQPLDLRKSI